MKANLKQKHIQDFVQDIEDFKFGETHKINLQQHMTPPKIAAQLLFHIYLNEPVEQYVIADIGVGTGMLMCGAIFLQPAHVIGFELDEQYIEHTREMLEQKVEGADYDLILADARTISLRNGRPIDLVVMNPPFGTRQAGIDMQFLSLAMKICRGNIYSMHKSSTRKFIHKFCEQRNYGMEVVFQVKFPLKKRFKGYHKKQVEFTEVDIIVVKPNKNKMQEIGIEIGYRSEPLQQKLQKQQHSKQVSPIQKQLRAEDINNIPETQGTG